MFPRTLVPGDKGIGGAEADWGEHPVYVSAGERRMVGLACSRWWVAAEAARVWRRQRESIAGDG